MPVDPVGQTRRSDGLRGGELTGHGLADREQRLFQPDEKQRESQQDEDEAGHDAPQIRRLAAQHRDLEHDEDDDDRRHVQHGGHGGGGQSVQEFHAHATMP